MKTPNSWSQSLVTRFPDLSKRMGIIVVFISAIILAPLIASKFLPALAIAAVFFAVLALIFFIRNPGVGFPLLIIAILFVPLSISTGTQTRINSALILVILLLTAWLVKMLIIDRQWDLISHRSIYAALVFILISFVSFGFGQLNWYPTHGASLFSQLGQVLIFIMSAGAFLVTAHRLENPNWLKATVYSFIILAGIYVIGFSFPFLRHSINRIFTRVTQDSLFWTWTIVLSFSQFLLNKSLKPLYRLGFLFITIISLYTLLITKQSWASGWLPAATALFVILFLTKPKIAIASVFGFIVVLLIRNQIIQNYVFVGDNQYSMLTRLEAWKILFQIIAKNPLFGVGPANYYFYTPYYNILGYSVSFNSHNNYIDILAQTGIIGFTIIVWWMVETTKAGFQLLKLKLDPFAHAFVFGTIGGIAGSLVAAFLGDWLLPFVYNIGMEGFRASVLTWVFMGSLIFLRQYYDKVGNAE